jgi:uncharacterized membrane protein YgdD (TMEM256/DUF423 family)
MIGKKNMVFGFFYFIATLGLGMYLAKMHNVPGITDAQKGIMRAAHAHGNMESFLNIAIGYLLCRLELNKGLAQVISIALIVGAALHSGMLYLGGLGYREAFALAPIGAFSLVLTVLLMGVGVLTLKTVD